MVVLESIMHLSKEEAVQFITKVLGISSPLKKLEEDRTLFLNDLIKAFYCSVLFQNITLLSKPEANRHVPTWEEVKAAVMGGRGGLCYPLSVFMTYLLEALGYEVYFPASSIFWSNNHMTTIVQNLSFPGSKHLVDVTGFPTFEAVPLDFEKESPVYSYSFLEFKFVKEGNKILRFHRKSDKLPFIPASIPGREYIVDEWRRVCEVEYMVPRELSFFEQPMTDVYTKPGVNSPFLVSFRAVVYRDLKLIAIKDTTLLLENDKHELEVTKVSSREEMVRITSKYFPQFTVEEVTKAMDTLHLLELQS